MKIVKKLAAEFKVKPLTEKSYSLLGIFKFFNAFSNEEYGKDFLTMLRGMFAFVIWDVHADLLFGARDRLGKKPLYYYEYKDTFVFASELKPIMLFPYFEKSHIKKLNLIDLFQYSGNWV